MFDLFEKLINEHGSAVILRERLEQIREEIQSRDEKIIKLEQEKLKLESQIFDLQAQLSEKIAIIQDSLTTPFRVSDEYTFDTDGGYWIERSTSLRVCLKCLMPPTKIVCPLYEGMGSGYDGQDSLVWRCGNCKTEYFHEVHL